jgi:hypothetical protein
MRKLAAFLLILVCAAGMSLPMQAQVHTRPASHSPTKEEKKQIKAQKKYAKAQKKAEKKMLKTEKKNSYRYPSHPN